MVWLSINNIKLIFHSFTKEERCLKFQSVLIFHQFFTKSWTDFSKLKKQKQYFVWVVYINSCTFITTYFLPLPSWLSFFKRYFDLLIMYSYSRLQTSSSERKWCNVHCWYSTRLGRWQLLSSMSYSVYSCTKKSKAFEYFWVVN